MAFAGIIIGQLCTACSCLADQYADTFSAFFSALGWISDKVGRKVSEHDSIQYKS